MSTATASPVPAVAQVLEMLRAEHPATMRALTAIPADQLGYRPHEKSMSLGELAWHIAYSQLGIAKAIAASNFQAYQQPPQPADLQAIVAGGETYFNLACETIAGFTPETLAGSIPLPNGSQIPNMMFLWINLFHQIHHRGQLSVYIRLAGGKVPAIYGPSADVNPFA